MDIKGTTLIQVLYFFSPASPFASPLYTHDGSFPLPSSLLQPLTTLMSPSLDLSLVIYLPPSLQRSSSIILVLCLPSSSSLPFCLSLLSSFSWTSSLPFPFMLHLLVLVDSLHRLLSLDEAQGHHCPRDYEEEEQKRVMDGRRGVVKVPKASGAPAG